MLKGKTVLLGVTGSIAAYKIAGLASMLVKQHADVTVLMTRNATNFIHPTTFETLTGNKCLIDTFDRNFQFSVEHPIIASFSRKSILILSPVAQQTWRVRKASHTASRVNEGANTPTRPSP